MNSRATEDYLKAIYDLQGENAEVETNALASRLAVTAASVSGMLKRLALKGLVEHTPYYGVALTGSGRRAALRIIRRHRLLECLLYEMLGVPWEELHTEAERLEHHISSRFEARIDRLLGYPTTDPHGSPIPTKHGTLEGGHRFHLSELLPGQTAVVVEVRDRDPVLLAYLARLNLFPGTRVVVVACTPVDQLLTVVVDSTRYVLGPEITSHVFVSGVRSCEIVASLPVIGEPYLPPSTPPAFRTLQEVALHV